MVLLLLFGIEIAVNIRGDEIHGNEEEKSSFY
jgi:hypothetical protein